MPRRSFSIHSDFYAELSRLSNEQRGQMLAAFIDWASDTEPPSLDIECSILFRLMTAQTERISAANSANGALGGRPRKADESENTEKSEISEKSGRKRKKASVTNTVAVADAVTDTVSKTSINNDNGDRAGASDDTADLPEDMRDDGAAKIHSTYTANIRMPSAIEAEKLIGWLDTFGGDIICYAIKQAALSGGRTYRMVETILFRWQEIGVRDMPSAEAAQREWDNKTRGAPPGGPPRKQPPSFDGLKALGNRYAQEEAT